MTELVHLEVGRGTATVTLDSPANRNALSRQLRAELADRLAAALADDGVRTVVLTHTGPVFCSGMDLAEARGADPAQQGVRELPALIETLWTSPKPTVARARRGRPGPAGIGLVAACDVAVAADTATFAFLRGPPRARARGDLGCRCCPGCSPATPMSCSSPARCSTPPGAVRVGLLNRAVPADGLDAEVDRYTAMLGLGAPGALAQTKRLLVARTASLSADLDAATELSARAFALR